MLLLEETAGSCALCQIKSHRQANKIKQCRQPLWFSCDIAGAVQYIYLLIFNFVYKSIESIFSASVANRFTNF
jgi:hypothetical protein